MTVPETVPRSVGGTRDTASASNAGMMNATPTERGTVSGTVTLFLDVSFGVAPVVLGLIANRAGYEPTFVFSAALAALGALLLIARRRSLDAPEEPADPRPQPGR